MSFGGPRDTVFMEPRGPLRLDGDQKELKMLARITVNDGRLYLPNGAGKLVESYDWEAFGRIVYRAVTGNAPPEQVFPAPDGGGL